MFEPTSKRRKLWWIIVPLAFLLFLVMTYQLINWYGQRSWEAYLAQADSPRDAELRQQYLAVNIPDDQNFVKTPLIEKNGYKGRSAGNIVLTSIPLPAWSDGDFRAGTWTHIGSETNRTGNITEDHKETARKFLTLFEPAAAELDELYAASQRSYSRFDSGLTFNSIIPNFVFIRNLVRLMALRAHAHLLLNQADKAFDDLWVVHRTAEGLSDHPTLVSAMIHVAVLGVELQPFYEGWARRQWTLEHYARFQTAFAKVDLLRNVDVGLRLGEKLGIRSLVETTKAVDLSREIFSVSNDQTEPMKALLMNATVHLIPKGFWQVNLRKQQETMEYMITNLYNLEQRRILTDQVENVAEDLQARIKLDPTYLLTAVATPNGSKFLRRPYAVQTTIDQAIIVCALERFKAKNDSYPASLTELLPDFCDKLPLDLVCGKPPIYIRNSDGSFRLYSLGWNGQDDGGRAGEDLDLVWPFHQPD